MSNSIRSQIRIYSLQIARSLSEKSFKAEKKSMKDASVIYFQIVGVVCNSFHGVQKHLYSFFLPSSSELYIVRTLVLKPKTNIESRRLIDL